LQGTVATMLGLLWKKRRKRGGDGFVAIIPHVTNRMN
jgi:hypothetical protein